MSFEDYPVYTWKERYQWREIGITGYQYLVNVFYLGQWICRNCKEVVGDDFTYEEDCGCPKPDFVMYQDWVIDTFKSKHNRRKQ